MCEKYISKRKYCVIILLYRLFFLCNCNYHSMLVKKVKRINGTICVNIFINIFILILIIDLLYIYLLYILLYFLRFSTLLI